MNLLYRSIAAVLVCSAFLAGCPASSPRKMVKAGNEVVLQYIERTARLCTGASPVLPKAECLDRVDLAQRTQDALDAAGAALYLCPVDTACPAAQGKLAAAQALLSQLETYVYRGQ